MKYAIPISEFKTRISRLQEAMRREKLDLLLAFGNEAEPQYVRYLSDYWPSFETAGVLVPADGDAFLLIGPESLTYATDRSVVDKIRLVKAFRESSDPEYPGKPLDTFASVIDEALKSCKPRRFGVAGYSLMNVGVYGALCETLRPLGLEPERADALISDLRIIKSEREIACMRHAAEITHATFDYVLETMCPGMTEAQVTGLALGKMLELGAERESYPFWVLAGEGGNQAISRARQKTLRPGDLVHLQFGARVAGYASSIGRQAVLGRATSEQRALIAAGYHGHATVLSLLKAGVPAREVALGYERAMRAIGYDQYLLYGPCHGNGLMEGEAPWIENNSTFNLQQNMTFCVDVFLGDNERKTGLRMEDVVRVTAEGVENMTHYPTEIFEIV